MSFITNIYSWFYFSSREKKIFIFTRQFIDNSLSADRLSLVVFSNLLIFSSFFDFIFSFKKNSCFPNISKAISLEKRTLKFLLKIITPD